MSHCVRGECQGDSECPDSRACINYSCVDPCIGQCGVNAICEAQRHIAVCKCPKGYEGSAASSCVRQSRAYYPFSRYYKKKWKFKWIETCQHPERNLLNHFQHKH